VKNEGLKQESSKNGKVIDFFEGEPRKKIEYLAITISKSITARRSHDNK
jgi:hypothetical protein